MKFPQKRWKQALLLLAGLFVLIQAVPYGRTHDNPAVTKEPAWDSPRTRVLAMRVCGDCHSNETTWPWYSHVAPFSWLVQFDVEEGREHFNFSEMDTPQRHAEDAAEEYEEGEMPPWQYTLSHGDAKLGEAERAELLRGLRATFGGTHDHDHDDDDDDDD